MGMEKKKILFVINTMGHAGAEMAMLALMKRLDLQKYELYLYVLMGQGELINRVPDNVVRLNGDYNETSVLSHEGKKYMRSRVLGCLFRRGNVFRLLPYMALNGIRMLLNGRVLVDKLLWRCLSDGAQDFDMEFDLAVAFLEGGSAYYVADHVNAKRKAAFIHIDYGMSGYTRKLDRDCYLRYDRVFAVSDEVRESFAAAYPEIADKTMVFHNFLDVDEIKRMAVQGEAIWNVDEADGGINEAKNGKAVRILTVGRITEQKAYDVAVEAMRCLVQMGIDACWYVVGDGPLRGRIQQMIDGYGLGSHFVLLGAKSNPYPYFANADIYAHCTRFEGKSIAIQEAQVLGLPVIASDCNGNREQIQDGVDGILCELNPVVIAEKLRLLIEDGELRARYAQRSCSRVINHDGDLEKLLGLLES
jgi:glycosyltransferase involved in cell wall biosynthesis